MLHVVQQKMSSDLYAFNTRLSTFNHVDAISAFHFRDHQVVLGSHPAWTLTKASLFMSLLS
jgi:hypothetical protein